MTSEEFVAKFETLTKEMIEKMKAKNNDYAGKRDPLKNLRRHGTYGIIVRLDDKLSRLDSFLNPAEGVKQMVKDESIRDTFMDAATYNLLGIIMREAERPETAPTPGIYEVVA